MTFRLFNQAVVTLIIFHSIKSASAQFGFDSSSKALDLQTIKTEAGSKLQSSQCGLAILGLVDTFTDGACPDLFNNVLGFFTDVPLPSINTSGNIAFNAPNLPEITSLTSICATGGCVADLALAFDDVDDACFDTNVPLTKVQRNQIRLLRAMIGVACLRDNQGEFCMPKAIDAFVNAAQELVSTGQTSTSNLSGRDVLCQPCFVELQKEIIAVFDADDFAALSQLACLRDQTTGEFCTADQLLRDGLAYAVNPLSTSSNTDPDLCTSCANQAIGVVSPLIGNSKYPENCYQTLSDDESLDISFDVSGFRTQFPQSGPSAQDAVRDDCAAAFGLPPDSIEVTAKFDYSTSSTRFTCTVSKTLKDVSVDEADLRQQMENSPMSNLNEDYMYLADNDLAILSAEPVEPTEEDTVTTDVDDETAGLAIGIIIAILAFWVLVIALSVAGCIFCCRRGYCCCEKKSTADEMEKPATMAVKHSPPDTVVKDNDSSFDV